MRPKSEEKSKSIRNDDALSKKFPGLAIKNDVKRKDVSEIDDAMAALEALAPSFG